GHFARFRPRWRLTFFKHRLYVLLTFGRTLFNISARVAAAPAHTLPRVPGSLCVVGGQSCQTTTKTWFRRAQRETRPMARGVLLSKSPRKRPSASRRRLSARTKSPTR